MNEQRFKIIWRGIVKLWHEQGHCMRNGSSRETLAGYYWEVNKQDHPAWLIRDVLMEAVYRGWVEKSRVKKTEYINSGVRGDYKTTESYTIFIIKK